MTRPTTDPDTLHAVTWHTTVTTTHHATLARRDLARILGVHPDRLDPGDVDMEDDGLDRWCATHDLHHRCDEREVERRIDQIVPDVAEPIRPEVLARRRGLPAVLSGRLWAAGVTGFAESVATERLVHATPEVLRELAEVLTKLAADTPPPASPTGPPAGEAP